MLGSVLVALLLEFFGSDQMRAYLMASAFPGAFFSLGLLFFTIGQIQRAIWFLPGDDQK